MRKWLTLFTLYRIYILQKTKLIGMNETPKNAVGQTPQNGEILIYKAETGQTEIQVRLVENDLWLNQEALCELFQSSKSTISYHLSNVLETEELEEFSTVRIFRTVATNGKPYQMKYYNLPMIIAVGFRVNARRGVHFRQWANKVLGEYLTKGFVMDDARLANEKRDHFEELTERVRRIRTSERNFYLKVRDIFASSLDYDPKTREAKIFFAQVQNMFHFAIHGHTAAELIVERIDVQKVDMGLTTWTGPSLKASDGKTAKNYLTEFELKRLNLLVEQYLSFAELQALERRPMYMSDWLRKLKGFFILNDKPILEGLGKVSRAQMEKKVDEAFREYNQRQKALGDQVD